MAGMKMRSACSGDDSDWDEPVAAGQGWALWAALCGSDWLGQTHE